jgi:hypothetical protein
VPNEKSRSGRALVPTPGLIRLPIELGIFAIATWALYDLEKNKLCVIFGAVIILHYILSYDRIAWLLSK